MIGDQYKSAFFLVNRSIRYFCYFSFKIQKFFSFNDLSGIINSWYALNLYHLFDEHCACITQCSETL
jgi:hypothetical protein